MEENKENVVSMNKNVESESTKKLSYEELEKVAHQLSEQSKNLYMKLQASNMTNMFKRLDYLFKVVENKDKFSEDFAAKCIEEIQNLMTVSEEEDESENKD